MKGDQRDHSDGELWHSPDPHPPEWLHAAWICQLRWHYDLCNEEYLGGQLRAPVIRINSSRRSLGQWEPQHRTLAISEGHILEHPWESVVDTLRHEMAHQYVDEVLELSDAPPHAEPFAKACRLLRCDAAASADRAGLGRIDRSTAERDRMLTRIKELLALAGSPNEHEAANAMRLAHKYLLRYNLDMAQIEGRNTYAMRHLGKPSRRLQEYEYTLSSILQDHFFVLAIWTFSYDARCDMSGRILQISGTPENLEMSEYVYDYLLGVSESLWKERRRATAGNGRARKGERRGTKFQYLAGLLRGFQEKLDRQDEELEQEHGLIWLGDPELRKYFDHLHPRTRSVARSGVSHSDQYRAGVEDGHEIQIRRGIRHDAGNRGRRLMGPGT